MPQQSTPAAALIVREYGGHVFYDAKFRWQGRQIKRRIGPAWLDRDTEGNWVPRKGRVPADHFDARKAHVVAAGIVAQYVSCEADRERIETERRTRGVTFRDVAAGYLDNLERVKGAKPSTLRDYKYLLAEPGTLARRRSGVLRSHILSAIGDKPCAKIKASDILALRDTITATGVSARTWNKHLNLIRAIFNYGMREETFGLTANPAHSRLKRAEPDRGRLNYYRPHEVEAVARALEDEARHGTHETDADSAQDADMVRVSAYAGLRLGELLALRWRDIDLAGHVVTISRAMSAGIESPPKSGKFRQVPLSDQTAAALDRVSRREHFTGPDELVFCSVIGRPLDGSALRRRYRRAQTAAGVAPLRWHDLRHSFGSMLAAKGMDLVTIQAFMGHSDLATTGRYLHARPASEKAAELTRVFAPAPVSVIA